MCCRVWCCLLLPSTCIIDDFQNRGVLQCVLQCELHFAAVCLLLPSTYIIADFRMVMCYSVCCSVCCSSVCCSVCCSACCSLLQFVSYFQAPASWLIHRILVCCRVCCKVCCSVCCCLSLPSACILAHFQNRGVLQCAAVYIAVCVAVSYV